MSAHLPQLSGYRTGREMVTAFRGYNHTELTALDELYDMRNLSGDGYPSLVPRGPRSVVGRLERPNGLFARGKLCWVDGTDFVYDGTVRGQVADSKKQFVAMGAYVLIWPDKAYYNTETEEFGSLDAEHVTTGAVMITLCRADGSAYEDYTTSDTPPSDPRDGDLWVNTSVTPHVLQQYSTTRGMWVSMPTTYVKLAATGIGRDFAAFDGVTISGCSEESLNGDMVLQGAEEDAVVVIGIIESTLVQMTPLTISRKAPDMDYLTEMGNRVWGCSSAAHEVYACKLGDPKNWRCYMGVSTDSYAATIGTAGDFTGACTHMGYVMFFKEDVVHRVYGYKPSNFEITDTMARGVQQGCEGSLAVVNETLYYKARSGVCAFGMALPQGVAAALGPVSYRDAVAGSVGDKYYVSMRSVDGWSLLVFDESRGMWHKEDETQALAFATLDGVLYCLRADGVLLAMNAAIGEAEAERVEWMAETGDIGIQSPDKKYVTKLQLRLTVDVGALVRIRVKYDRLGEWKEVCRINPQTMRSVTVPIVPRRCDTMRLRLDGYGMARVHSLARTIEEGSER